MVNRSQEVSTDAEQILHDTVNRREALELSGRLETPHLALTLSGRLMGGLRAVVRVLIGAVEHRWHHRATGGRVTAQLVGDQGRCCTNRDWPARCPPTGSSPADAIRHWSAEGGHPIEDLTAKDDLTPLPGWTPGAKAIADDGLVSEERVLHPALTMVP